MTRAIVSFVVLSLWAALFLLLPSACTLPEPVDGETGCYIDGSPSLCFPWIIRVPVIPDAARPSDAGDAGDGSRDGASDARSDASDASDAGDAGDADAAD